MILLTDSYKVTHWRQYPPNTQTVYSYFESRGGDYSPLVFFGLQYILKKYFLQPITLENIKEAKHFYDLHLGAGLFNELSWMKLLEKHKGLLPLRIRAYSEGSQVPTRTPLITIENTDPEFYWLTNYVETILVQVWYPTTVCSLSKRIHKMIRTYLEETGDPSQVDFKLHDFGFRGVSSVESAGIGGAAHLVNFKGTDTVQALKVLKEYYHADMAGFSIPAAEHSTITSWGRNNEVQAFQNMLEQFKSYPFVAVVSDSYDVFHACEKIWGEQLKPSVEKFKGTLVIRPDSGEPVAVVLKCLEILGNKFGSTLNKKGFKVLNKVRLIQGDGVNETAIQAILHAMKERVWSANNIAFGMGGALLQKLNRDTSQFAFKCSAIQIDGQWRDVYKEPVTARESKGSKAGRFNDPNLRTVFENGKLLVDESLETIRARLN